MLFVVEAAVKKTSPVYRGIYYILNKYAVIILSSRSQRR